MMRMQDRLQNMCSVLARPYGRTVMSPNSSRLVHRIMGGLDLLIDFATLGEYGLQELPADGPGCEGIGRRRVAPTKPEGAVPTGWEALAPARRGSLRAHPRLRRRDRRTPATLA
jgi:hypothetical protein